MPLWAACVIFLVVLAGLLLVIFVGKSLNKALRIAAICILGVVLAAALVYILLTFLFLDSIDYGDGSDSDYLQASASTVSSSETLSENISSSESSADSGASQLSSSSENNAPEPMPADYDLPVSEVPELVPDILSIRDLKYEEMPVFSTLNETAKFALWNFLNNRFEFECYLTRELAPSEGDGHAVLYDACQCAMSYYLFSAYREWDMLTEDRGDEQGVYARVKLIYYNPEYDLEAKAEALEFVLKNPVPYDGFKDRQSEMEYAKKIQDYIGCKITYSPIGYNPKEMLGNQYEDLQEAYNVLAEDQNSAVCAGYARGFALIAQYAGINCAWVWGNETEESSHAWNVIFPCDGSEPVLVDVTWDDGLIEADTPGQTVVGNYYFYYPLSTETEHTADAKFEDFLFYINGI